MTTKVLVADDSKMSRLIITDMFLELGVDEIFEAADGREAMKAFNENDIDLVVVDWQMPGMCGLEVIKQIRGTGSAVPIIMVTATGTRQEHVIDAINAGASDYVVKPFDPAMLRGKLRKYCLRIK